MNNIAEVLEDSDLLCAALTAVKALLTKRQMDDLEALFSTGLGVAVQQDAGGRWRGDTVYSCSRIGGRLTERCGVGPDDNMMWVGRVVGEPSGERRWALRPQLRSALKKLVGWGGGPADAPTAAAPPVVSGPAPSDELDERFVRFAVVKTRLQQADFRKAVFYAFDGACAVSGCTVPEALEAAHRTGRNWQLGHNAAEDGILLRRDLHALYDAGLLKLTADGEVVLHPKVIGHYGDLAGVERA